MLLKNLIFASFVVACLSEICPMQNHTVCNEDIDEDHACVCAMGGAEDPPPEKSCNLLLNVEDKVSFPAVSITFKLDETTSIHDTFPEMQFKEQLAHSLKEDEHDIIILRQGCFGDDNHHQQYVVQFVIRNKDADDAEMPYEADDFLDPKDIVQKIKVLGHLTQFVDFDIDSIDAVNELIDIEGNADNSLLLIQAAVVAVVVVITCMLGIWIAVRKGKDPEYSANLQKV